MLEGPHLRSYGNRSCWGSEHLLERDFLLSIHGTGWHLARCHFEELVARVAIESGAEWHYDSRIRSIRWRNPRWQFSIEKLGKKQDVEADFLVDATGRKACVARQLGARRVYDDHLVGVAAQLEPVGNRGTVDTFTLVEAVASGWWYSALLANRRLAVVYMTDHDLSDFLVARQCGGWWERLSQTRYLWPQVRAYGYRICTPLRILPVNSTRLTTILGERWLAVGDAAASYDPLSSYGITSAMGTGFYAAHAIADLLKGHAEAGLAYLSILEKAYAIYLKEQRKCYTYEQRWVGYPFWDRRQCGFPLKKSSRLGSLVKEHRSEW
jgi:flavin-dependent dehydrogenase